jgi:hypothetical protein
MNKSPRKCENRGSEVSEWVKKNSLQYHFTPLFSKPCYKNKLVTLRCALHLSTSTMAKWNLKLFIAPYCLGLGLSDYIRVVWSPIKNGSGWKHHIESYMGNVLDHIPSKYLLGYVEKLLNCGSIGMKFLLVLGSYQKLE